MEKKYFCPRCGKNLYVTQESVQVVSEKFHVPIKLRIWCKRCKKEVVIEI